MFFPAIQQLMFGFVCLGLAASITGGAATAVTDEERSPRPAPTGLQTLVWSYWGQLRAAHFRREDQGADDRETFREMLLSARLDRAHEEVQQAYREIQQLQRQVEAAQVQLEKERSRAGRLTAELTAARQQLMQALADNTQAAQERENLVRFLKGQQKKDEQMREEVRQQEEQAMRRELQSLKELLHRERSARGTNIQAAQNEGLAPGKDRLGAKSESTHELSREEIMVRLNQALRTITWPPSDIPGDGEYVDTPLSECLDMWREIYRLEIVLSDEVKTESGVILINGRVSGMTFAEELTALLQPLGLTYSVEGGTRIVISRR